MMNSPVILDHHGNPYPSTEVSSSFSDVYEGASTSDRMGMSGLSAAGPNAGAFSSLTAMKKRSRDKDRNSGIVKGAIDSFVSNLVGTDISPSWDLANKEQKEELEECWKDSQPQMSFDGFTDFYGSQELACRAMIRDGEVLGRFHDIEPSFDTVVPLQVQLLESDHLDPGYSDISPEGNEIRFGIEWKKGRRYKYWLYPDHPGENFLFSDPGERIPVDAKDSRGQDAQSSLREDEIQRPEKAYSRRLQAQQAQIHRQGSSTL